MKALGAKLRLLTKVFLKRFVFAWQIETAYAGSTVGALISTLFYNITFLVFIDIVLKKYTTLAGYTFPDMVVLIFIGQFAYYSGLTFSYKSAEDFVTSVRNGTFDTMLIKPISVFFQVMTMGIQPFSGIMFSIPPLLIYVYLIVVNQAFHPTPFGLTIGILGTIMGVILLHFYRFAYAMLIFKARQIDSLMKTLDMVSAAGTYPYEAYGGFAKIIVLVISPLLAAAGIPTVYFLNKTVSFMPILLEAGILILLVILTILLWKDGLKRYESASS